MRKVLLLLALLAGAVQAQAQVPSYPNKPIRMVVGFPPGGGTDVVARILSPRMSELLGQPIVIENRPGATGTMAAGQVAKSPPDGYTIMMGHVSVNAIAPALFANLPYDVIKDFAPVAIAAAVPHLVTVHPSLQVQNLKELIQHLKSKPEMTFPSAGNGSMPHLAGEIFKSLAGVKMVHVPYKGSRPVDAGPARRRAPSGFRHDAGGDPAREIGQAARDRGVERLARAIVCGRADGGGGGASRVPGDHLVRHLRAGGNAAGASSTACTRIP